MCTTNCNNRQAHSSKQIGWYAVVYKAHKRFERIDSVSVIMPSVTMRPRDSRLYGSAICMGIRIFRQLHNKMTENILPRLTTGILQENCSPHKFIRGVQFKSNLQYAHQFILDMSSELLKQRRYCPTSANPAPRRLPETYGEIAQQRQFERRFEIRETFLIVEDYLSTEGMGILVQLPVANPAIPKRFPCCPFPSQIVAEQTVQYFAAPRMVPCQ